MVRQMVLGVVFCVFWSCLAANAQQQCLRGTPSNKLICTVPQVFGAAGLGPPTLTPDPVTRHDLHFESDFQTSFTPLNSAVGTQLSLLQLASPASGIIFTFDRTLGVVQRSNESYGPIFSERAETIGRHKLYVGVTYAYYRFNSLDGISLHSIPAVFQHVDTAGDVNNPGTCLNGPSPTAPAPPCNPVPTLLDSSGHPTYVNNGSPAYEKDYISTVNDIDLKVNQVTAFATFGLTNRIDVSVAIPIPNVRMGVRSATTINPISVNPTAANFGSPQNRYHHTFNPATVPSCGGANPCLDADFSNSHTATGIGDVTFRVKGTVWKGEHAGLALGADVRTPTGDEQNFLGSGAWGFKPFIAASYRARVSPHANIGFEWNGSSILGADATHNTGRLPRELFYSAGVDVGLTRRLTVAADLLGTRVFSTVRLVKATYLDSGSAVTGVRSTVPDIFQTRASINIDDGAIGLKYSPAGNLLITADVQFKLNEGGLRANVVPLVGVSYTF